MSFPLALLIFAVLVGIPAVAIYFSVSWIAYLYRRLMGRLCPGIYPDHRPGKLARFTGCSLGFLLSMPLLILILQALRMWEAVGPLRSILEKFHNPIVIGLALITAIIALQLGRDWLRWKGGRL